MRRGRRVYGRARRAFGRRKGAKRRRITRYRVARGGIRL